MPELFCCGFGYSARVLARRLLKQGWNVSGTSRSREGCECLREQGFDALVFAGDAHEPGVADHLSRATHLLLSAPPDEAGDPLLNCHGSDFEKAASLEWTGYLSTIGVYGNQDGAWIDEDAPLNTSETRNRRRIDAERAWLEIGKRSGKSVQIFRLAGIYGPGRSAIDKLKQGKARRIIKPGQVFNRIHVEDIANAVEASIARPNPGAIYNVCDNEPAPPQDLISYGAKLIGVDAPPEIPFDQADLTPMARSFYGENKRVSNERIKSELGMELAFPTYRDGLRSVAAGE